MTTYALPETLQHAILNGRCIAFIGAGFSAGVVPPWPDLLRGIAAELRIPLEIDPKGGAFHFEVIGQRLQDQAGERWEPTVRRILERAHASAPQAERDRLAQRCELLNRIPFKAILTTNFDHSLDGVDTTPATYWEVLRAETRWWNSAPSRKTGSRRRVPLVKLHGDANGDPKSAPLVLGRADYRRRVYEDSSYASFLRAAFAGYTLLFLGVSFTDAYLNELRSDVLKTIRGVEDDSVWGYAVMNRPGKDIVDFFRRYEAVHVLTDPTEDHSGFDVWLETIANATSIEGRLRTLLAGKNILWIDPNPGNNERGYRLLTESSGAHVDRLRSYGDLDEARHSSADLVLTNFGHESSDQSHAFRVLERLNTWKTRPAVIVFAGNASPEQLRANRERCLRRGAWEYAVEWGELYRAIELLVGRNPGQQF